MSGFMNPESNGLAPGGNDTSDGFSAIVESPSTECRVLALLTHSTVCPTLIMTLSGRNFDGLSLILITTAGAFAPRARVAAENANTNEAATANAAPKKRQGRNFDGLGCELLTVVLGMYASAFRTVDAPSDLPKARQPLAQVIS